MVDSAHQSVAQLKAELADAAADAEDARAAADTAERRLAQVRRGGGASSAARAPVRGVVLARSASPSAL
jgi:hypothetical protein